MKKLIYILLFLIPFFGSAQTVEILGMNKFADHTEGIKGAFKIYRHNATTGTLTVNYTVSGAGASFTDLTSGSVVIPQYSQSVLIEFSTTSNPSSDETLTITITADAAYSVGTWNSETFTITSTTPVPAFTSAEGAAKYTGSRVSANTWRGGDVYFVTNLNASGTGSLTAAISAANSAGGGYVIFRVGGEIAISTRINMSTYKGIYIAGQTAPGDGVYVSGYGASNGVINMSNANDILIRYVNFDHGNALSGGSIDAFSIFNSRDIYVNHCSIIRGDDEIISAMNTDYQIEHGRVTLDWNFIGEGYYTYSPFKNHNTGSLMGALGSTDVRRQNAITTFSWNKNITYNVSHRFPNASGYGHFESINNVIGNHSNRFMQVAYPQPKVNWVGNYIVTGPQTNGLNETPFTTADPYPRGNLISKASYTYMYDHMGLMYADGNVMQDYITESDDDWIFNSLYSFNSSGSFDGNLYDPVPVSQKLANPVDIYGSTNYMTAANAFTAVTGAGGAGASKRIEADGSVTNRRNTFYQSRINEIVNDNISSYIDSGDWSSNRPSFTTNNSPYADTDNDGMADTWETANGLNVGVADHNGHDLHPVYDNIEVFLNLVDETTEVVDVTGVTVTPSTTSVEVGSTVSLTATVAPVNATNKTGVWSSSNSSAATVNQSGVVTGVADGEGTATITFTTNDGSFTDTCVVTVNAVVVPVIKRVSNTKFQIFN